MKDWALLYVCSSGTSLTCAGLVRQVKSDGGSPQQSFYFGSELVSHQLQMV